MGKEIRKCIICGSSKKTIKTDIGILCGKHYSQYKRHGKIPPRSKHDPNEFVIIDNCVYIHLYDKNGNKIAEAIVDIDKYNSVSQHKWCLDKAGYVKNSKQEYLHRFVANTNKDYVDHINGNKLDNRIQNLRICTNAQNCQNKVSLPKNNTSGTLGVRFREDRQKWYAEIQYNGIKKHVGVFKNKEDAIKARIKAEKEYFGEFKSKILNKENEVNRV